jgi:4-hydroxybenzoate polyprenyltransferase
MIQKLRNSLTLMRPYQYVKNGFVLLPLFFGRQLFQIHCLKAALIAFSVFCLVASAVYIFNDVLDIEADRDHPTKRYRPLAARHLSVPWALVQMGLLLALGLGLAWTQGMAILGLVLGYIGLNVAYSLILKHLAIIDVFVIAIGFFIRLELGSVASATSLSTWIIIMSYLLALFLGFAKRRDDLILADGGVSSGIRASIAGYNLKFLDAALVVLASVIMVAYLMYTISDHVIAFVGSTHLFYTSIFVLFGLLRYLQITIVENRSGNPTRILLRDRALQMTVGAWFGSLAWILYG